MQPAQDQLASVRVAVEKSLLLCGKMERLILSALLKDFEKDAEEGEGLSVDEIVDVAGRPNKLREFRSNKPKLQEEYERVNTAVQPWVSNIRKYLKSVCDLAALPFSVTISPARETKSYKLQCHRRDTLGDASPNGQAARVVAGLPPALDDADRSETLCSVRRSLSAHVLIALSPLVVIRAILDTCDLRSTMQRLGYTVAFVEYPWSDKILEDLAGGQLDMAIYNRARSESFLHQLPIPRIQIVPGFGHSMGGHNFYVLARSNQGLVLPSPELLLNSFAGLKILVPYGSDIHENLQDALGVPISSLGDLNIQLVDHPSNIGLETLQTIDNGLLVAGQNPRAQALYRGGYKEILTAGQLSPATSRIVVKRSENALLFGATLCKLLSPAQLASLAKELWLTFQNAWNDRDFYEEHLHDLAQSIQGHCASFDEAHFVVRHILFHTYRFGCPDVLSLDEARK